MISFTRPAADLHGRPFDVAPGVPRGTHDWRIDFAGAVDQWFCPRCGAEWLSSTRPSR